jgi:hypothetical protein
MPPSDAIRSTATDLTCSACAFASRPNPVAGAASITSNGGPDRCSM